MLLNFQVVIICKYILAKFGDIKKKLKWKILSTFSYSRQLWQFFWLSPPPPPQKKTENFIQYTTMGANV